MIWDELLAWLAVLLPTANVLAAAVVTGHIALTREDTRGALGWIGLVWLAPVLGLVVYVAFGINRVRRRARNLWSDQPLRRSCGDQVACHRALRERFGGHEQGLVQLGTAVDRVTRRPLVGGNRIEPLDGGAVAYPRMLAAIAGASRSVELCTYIFERDEVGRDFVGALGEARARGVEVRVLVDDIGLRYSFPTVEGALRAAGVTVGRFNPARALTRLPYINLRNHRKLLVVDGRLGFTGGMNIRAETAWADDRAGAVRDLHFELEGPVVRHLREDFAVDWRFTTGEMLALAGGSSTRRGEACGAALARGIPDGPDEDLDKHRWVLLSALACARRRVQVLTPYFVPDDDLIGALATCALRGIEVDVILPARSNLPVVGWASRALLPRVLEPGCRVWASPPPFDHSKLLVVDDAWCFFGSSNWDARSLRLNFELGVECYEPSLAARLAALCDERRRGATPLTLATLAARSFPARLRDGVARLAGPYL